jgi:hypothetical protein
MLKISKEILELEDATKEQFAAYLKANQTSAERKFRVYAASLRYNN